MAILKDLIVHGSSRFLNKIYASEIQTPLIEAEAGIIKKLKANDATIVGLLDVKGQLHTNSWSNSNIATIDGSFYITPTIGSDSGTVSITSSSLTFSGTNYAISSLYLGDGSSITWPQYSKVLVTGQILLNGEWIPLGTLLGQISGTATATSISINNIKDNKKPPSNTSNVYTALVNSGISSTDYRNLKVSLYQRASSSTAFYPLGIYMTATGTNGRTFLDIYGGVEALSNSNNYGGFAEPNVRIGNLQGLPNVGGQTPSGWGIYTDNGYFKGIIAADQGYIGSGSKYWVIANYEDGSNPNNSRSYIYNNTDSMSSTAEGIYLGTDGIRNYKDSTHFVTIQNGVINAKGVNLTGTINATEGNIGGATITGGNLTVPAAKISGQLTAATIDASKINSGDISSDRITTNVLTALQAKLTSLNTNNLSAITANLGTITAGVIKHDTVGGTNGIWFSADTDTSSNVTIGNSTARKDWRLLVNNKFGVTKEGNLYASNVDLTGKITATSGTIGGINIIDGDLDVSSISIGMNQVTNLSTALEGKQAAGDYATNTALNNVSTTANTALGQSVWYAECPTAAGTAVKVATVSPVTTAFPNPLVNGTTVNVKFTETNSATNTSLKLNVNGTGEKSIKYIYNGAITDIVAGYLKANQMYQFRYDGTYWIVQMMRNTNDDHYDRSLYSVALAASAAISAGRIAVLGVDNKLHLLNTTSFNITCPPLYVATAYTAANVSSAATKTSNYTYWGTAFTLTDTHSIANAVANSNVYIVGTLLGDIFTPTTAVLTCAEPTTENGLYYMLLGRMSTPTKAILQAEHPIYVFRNGKFQKLEATTATNYITQIDNTGIKITPYDKSGNDYLQLNSNAISMYRNNIETLRIEDSAIRIGKDNEAHFSLTSSRLTGYGDNNNVYFDVGKGSNTTIQLFYGNGNRTSFEMGPLVKEIVSVKKENNTLTQGTDYTIDTVSIWYDIYFEQEPALNSTVKVSYESTNKEFIYTVGSSQNITTEQVVVNPEGRYKTTIVSQSAYKVREISQKSSMGEDWWNPIYNYSSELEGNVYKYIFYTQTAIENGEKFKLTYLLSDDSNFTPDIETKEYTWDTSRQGSLNLTISGVNEIQTVKVNNVSVNYTTEGPLYKDYIILNTALGQDEKIEVEFKTRNYNSEYYSTYFNFSNMNKEDSVKGIGSASFGSENVNKGVFCLAEGVGNTVTGYASHAEGYNNVVAGSHAHAEGWQVKALGENSHAGGSNTTAIGLNSFVHGNYLNAIYPNSAAFGYGNNAQSQLFSIGMGLSQNAFSVNQDGDVQIGGRLLSGTTYENRIPLFKVVERTFTAHGIGRNGGMTRVRDITVAGYKPIAILGIVVGNSPGHPTSGQVDASWCVVPRFWIGYDYTNDHSDYKTDSIYYYIWNLFTGTNVSGGVTVDITFKFLYISQTAYMGLTQSQTTS